MKMLHLVWFKNHFIISTIFIQAWVDALLFTSYLQANSNNGIYVYIYRRADLLPQHKWHRVTRTIVRDSGYIDIYILLLYDGQCNNIVTENMKWLSSSSIYSCSSFSLFHF